MSVFYEVVWLTTTLSFMLSDVLFCYFEMLDSPLLVTCTVLMRVLFQCYECLNISDSMYIMKYVLSAKSH